MTLYVVCDKKFYSDTLVSFSNNAVSVETKLTRLGKHALVGVTGNAINRIEFAAIRQELMEISSIYDPEAIPQIREAAVKVEEKLKTLGRLPLCLFTVNNKMVVIINIKKDDPLTVNVRYISGEVNPLALGSGTTVFWWCYNAMPGAPIEAVFHRAVEQSLSCGGNVIHYDLSQLETYTPGDSA